MSSGTSPWIVQPKAVDTPTSMPTCGAWALRKATMARTSASISSGVLRTLAIKCAALADTGIVSLCAPASIAASAPFRLGTSASTVTPAWRRACRTTSAASAICGNSRAGTNDATSISRKPAATSASIHAHLAAVGIVALTLCKPSRGPTSLINTSGVMGAQYRLGDAVTWR